MINVGSDFPDHLSGNDPKSEVCRNITIVFSFPFSSWIADLPLQTLLQVSTHVYVLLLASLFLRVSTLLVWPLKAKHRNLAIAIGV